MNTNATGPVHALRISGYKVRVTHNRYVANQNVVEGLQRVSKALKKKRAFDYIYPNGGETTMEVTTPTNKTYMVSAKCSKKDAFNRKLALRICVNRLMHASPEVATVLA